MKGIIAVIFGIFVAGFIAGFFLRASIIANQDVTPEGISLTIIKEFCSAMNSIDKNTTNTCYNLYFIFGGILLVGGILSFIGTISAIKDWRIGAAIYGVGFVIALVI